MKVRDQQKATHKKKRLQYEVLYGTNYLDLILKRCHVTYGIVVLCSTHLIKQNYALRSGFANAVYRDTSAAARFAPLIGHLGMT